MIANGEISVDSKVCLDPEWIVSLESSVITHKNKTLEKAPTSVIMLYKPRSVITSRKDEQGRPTVYSLLPDNLQHFHCVGRLDFATTGLLLLTNNTRLSSWLTDPLNKVQRVYTVTVRGLMTSETSENLQNGIIDNGERLQADNIIIRKSSRRESHLVITLTEGKNREIRRLCKSVGHEVTALKRVSYGGLSLGNLQPKLYREITKEELVEAFGNLPEAIITNDFDQ
jgi:pseudouridine synthase